MTTADEGHGRGSDSARDRELYALMAHLLRNSATAILANAELLRRHGDALEPDLTETLWTRLERHANAIASVCAEIARTEPVLALDKAHELTELLRAEADREALGLSNSDEA